MQVFTRFIRGLALVTLVLSLFPQLTFADYDFTTETLMQGGYDYSVTELSSTYDPEVSSGEYFTEHYYEMLGARPVGNDFVFDSDGFVHAAVNVGKVGLQYITNESGAWTYTTLTGFGEYNYGSPVEILIDSNEVLHVLYRDTNYELVYLTNFGGSWGSWTVAESVGSSGFDMTLDGNDNLHILYVNSDFDLAYAYFKNFEHRSSFPVASLQASYDTLENDDSEDSSTFDQMRVLVSGAKVTILYEKGTYEKYVYHRTKTMLGWDTTWSSASVVARGQFFDAELTSSGSVRAWYQGLGNRVYQSDLSGSTWTSILLFDMTYTHTEKIDFEISPLDDDIYFGASCIYDDDYGDEGLCELIKIVDGKLDSKTAFDKVEVTIYQHFLSLTLTEGGIPHMLYNDSSEPGYLKYTYVDTVGTTVSQHSLKYPSLASNSEGDPSIAYYYEYSVAGTPNGDLMLATETDGTWSTLVLDQTGDVGQRPSLAIDADDKLYVSYFYASDSSGYTKKQLKLATNCSGTWKTSTIDGTGVGAHKVGEYSALLVDSSGSLHVAYYDETAQALKYAKGSSCGNSWTTESVDDPSGADVGKDLSMAMDSDGKISIAYYDATNKDLKLASGKSGSWSVKTLDSKGDTGQYSSLALDAAGNVSISYYNATQTALYFISKNSGTAVSQLGVAAGWTRSTVDNSGNVGMYSSLDFDSADNPYISYYDSDRRALLLATQESGVWQNAILDDDSEGTGLWTSLDIDSTDWVRVAYITVSNGNLQFLQF